MKNTTLRHGQLPNAQQKTNPGDTSETQDETSDTGFNETLAHNAHFTDHPENTALATPENGETSETRSRTMTEKGFGSVASLKKNQRKPQTKVFTLTSQHSTHFWPARKTAIKLTGSSRI